ncbi:hypothetical protein [Adhaeribacter pallidiroseus]|uniref:Uncharacterized protein n=1 Tax=Adhaeribacter pallidiroseus TaxID=2072847 RepID=A0A369Q9L2_9BACT|nr:hypothetical protein [Adhaeribacter pallidiroseus]RDC61573.1 hypothetical protein AHMF7616_00152 [Adhaeribacter pallidiroseus]
MKESYAPVATFFREELVGYAERRIYISLQYFSDIREYLSTKAVIKEVYARDNVEYLALNTGEEIRLDRIIRVEGKPAPGFEDYFACAC